MSTIATTHKQMPEITLDSLKLAYESIEKFAASRKLVIKGNFTLDKEKLNFEFPSRNQQKMFQRSLGVVIEKPSMKSVNMFLHKLGKYTKLPLVKLEYFEKEKAIQSAKKEWKELMKKTEEARLKYKQEKGDFYKS
jgi:hypothetical protein